MKTRFFFALISLIILMLNGCGKEAVQPVVKNTLTLNHRPFPIKEVSITGSMANNEGHAWILFLYNSSNSYNTLVIDIDYSGNSDVTGNYSYPLQVMINI